MKGSEMNSQNPETPSVSFAHWLRWRGLPRFGLAASVCAAAAGAGLLHEAAVWKSPRQEALVYPPIAELPIQIVKPKETPVTQPVQEPPVQEAAPQIVIKPTQRKPSETKPLVTAVKPVVEKVEPKLPAPVQHIPKTTLPVVEPPVKPPEVPKPEIVAPKPVITAPAIAIKTEPKPPVEVQPVVEVKPVPKPPVPAVKVEPPQEYDQVVTRVVNITARDLRLQDFHVTSSDPAIHWEVTAADFQENVDRQVEERKDISLTMLFDQSGSIRSTDTADSRIPAAQGLVGMMSPGTRIAVVHFQSAQTMWGGIRFDVKADQSFTDNPRMVRRAISSLAGKADGGTPLYTALAKSIKMLENEPSANHRYLVCFSDGVPDGDNPNLNPGEIVQRAKTAGVRLFFVALGSQDWSLLQQMAEPTGGEVIAVRDASKLSDAFSTLAQKVKKVDNSFYRVRLRAVRKGKPFTPSESLEGVIRVNGQPIPFAVTGK